MITSVFSTCDTTITLENLSIEQASIRKQVFENTKTPAKIQKYIEENFCLKFSERQKTPYGSVPFCIM